MVILVEMKMKRGAIFEKRSQNQIVSINLTLVRPDMSDVVLLFGGRKKMLRTDTCAWKNRASAQQWALPDATCARQTRQSFGSAGCVGRACHSISRLSKSVCNLTNSNDVMT